MTTKFPTVALLFLVAGNPMVVSMNRALALFAAWERSFYTEEPDPREGSEN